MIIYKDLLDESQEFFCDQSFKPTELDDFMIKLTAKMITKPGNDMSSVNIGANASAEEEQETMDDCAGTKEQCVDLCHYHKLVENDVLTGKHIKKYVNNYMSAIAKKLNEDSPGKGDEFKAIAKDKGNKLLKKIFEEGGKDLSVFVGEEFNFPEEIKGADGKKSWDVKQGCVLGVWHTDGMGLDMYMFKHGCIEEKV